MSEVNKFQDILGLNFRCVDAPPRVGSACPNVGPKAMGPQKNDANGDWRAGPSERRGKRRRPKRSSRQRCVDSGHD